MDTQTAEPQAQKQKTADTLEKLGFVRAASQTRELVARKRKLALAYEHYRFVRVENVEKFNQQLKERTIKGNPPYDAIWQELGFVPVSEYEQVPPEEVLIAHQEAVDRQCFDTFEIGLIKNVKDPLLFGRINKCSDRFFIAQWGDDVSITDLLKDNEG